MSVAMAAEIEDDATNLRWGVGSYTHTVPTN